MSSSVYLIKDPRDLAPRYVGVTNKKLKTRLSNHISEKGRSHRHCWIKSLKVLGLKPIIELLEEVDDSQRIDAERAWILGFRQSGADLVNGTDGGDGLINPSEETRKKN